VVVALHELDLDPLLLRHGIERQVFALPLASNFREFLTGREATANVRALSAETISREAVRRWVEPRALRFPDYLKFDSRELERMFRAPEDDSTQVLERSQLQISLGPS
jgi:hypothetical protein